MPQRITEAKILIVEELCPKCGTGTMKTIGIMTPSNPPTYSHRCDNCNHMETFEDTYPTIKTEDNNKSPFI